MKLVFIELFIYLRLMKHLWERELIISIVYINHMANNN